MNVQKLDSSLQNQLQMTAQVDDTVKVIVQHKAEILFSQAVDEGQNFRLFNATAMRMRQQDIANLSQDDLVEYIWSDWPMHAFLDTSVPKINVPVLQKQGLLGTGIKLAVIDTGIDPVHPDFAGRIVARASFISGEDDDNGHGTHVASIAAGNGNASQGKYRGVAPEASLYIAKVLDKKGDGFMSTVMAGIEWAVEQGVQVINLSLGGGPAGDGTDPLSILCDAVVERGIVVLATAGNSGPGDQTIGSPGSARDVITIGAASDTDRIANFSSRGPTVDGRTKPDLVLPGVGIIAAQAAGTEAGEVIVPGYVSLQGTSMATPHVAGVACLCLEANPDLSPVQIKQIFQQATVNLNAPANAQGTGRLDAQVALEKALVIKPDAPQPAATQPTEAFKPLQADPVGCLARLFGR